MRRQSVPYGERSAMVAPPGADVGGPPIISTRSVTKVFGSGERTVTAVNAVTLDVYPGEFVAVVGRSGSGKTSLLNLLAGLDRPTSGTVLFEGRDLAETSEVELLELRRHKIGFIFQSFGLIPLLSAYENVELPLHIGGVPWRERRRRAMDALDKVGLAPRARHRPYELSGGEQQRVAIARALVIKPQVIFADEPTGELDATTSLSICTTLQDVSRNQRVTVVVATHDPSLWAMVDRAVMLVDGALTSLSAQHDQGPA